MVVAVPDESHLEAAPYCLLEEPLECAVVAVDLDEGDTLLVVEVEVGVAAPMWATEMTSLRPLNVSQSLVTG